MPYDVTTLVFFNSLLVLSQHVCQLYAHGNDFLLILTYQASYVQKLESVHPLIEKIVKQKYSLNAI